MESGSAMMASPTPRASGNTSATASVMMPGSISASPLTMASGSAVTASASPSSPGSTTEPPRASAISAGSASTAFPTERTAARIFPIAAEMSPTTDDTFPMVACMLLIASRVSFPCWMISSWFFSCSSSMSLSSSLSDVMYSMRLARSLSPKPS